MSINYDKYKKSTGTHYISNTGKDEHGGTKGGKAGDQGGEYTLRPWYNRPWTVVLRWLDQSQADMAANMSIEAALNNNIGYDQTQRTTFWQQLVKANYIPANIKTPCEADCTASTAAIWKGVGYRCGVKALQEIPASTYSGNMKKLFVAAGFKALTASKYLSGHAYLLPGDVLLYEGHHACINVTVGSKVRDQWHPGDVTGLTELGDRVLQKGDSGPDVLELQNDLMTLGWDFPGYGADGKFGAETETNVKGFQRVVSLPVTGIFDRATYDALMAALHNRIEITGKSVNVRSGPGTQYAIIGIVHQGDLMPYGGQRSADGWYLVAYNGMNAWVSGKYARLV